MKVLDQFNLNAKQRKICELLMHKEGLTADQIIQYLGNNETLMELQELMNTGLIIRHSNNGQEYFSAISLNKLTLIMSEIKRKKL